MTMWAEGQTDLLLCQAWGVSVGVSIYNLDVTFRNLFHRNSYFHKWREELICKKVK